MASPAGGSCTDEPHPPPNSPLPDQMELPQTPENNAKRRRLSRDHPSPEHLNLDAMAGASPLTSPPKTDTATCFEDVPIREGSEDSVVLVQPDDEVDGYISTYPFTGFSTAELAAEALLAHVKDSAEIRTVSAFFDWLGATALQSESFKHITRDDVGRRREFWSSTGEALRVILNSSTFTTLMSNTSMDTIDDLITTLSWVTQRFIELEREQVDEDVSRRDSVGVEKEDFAPCYHPRYLSFFRTYHHLLRFDAEEELDSSVRQQAVSGAIKSAVRDSITDGRCTDSIIHICRSIITKKRIDKDLFAMLRVCLDILGYLVCYIKSDEDQQPYAAFVEELRQLFLIAESSLVPKLATQTEINAPLEQRMTMMVKSLRPLLDHLLDIDTHETSLFESKYILPTLSWSAAKDTSDAPMLSPSDFMAIIAVRGASRSAMLATAWCMLRSVSYMRMPEKAAQISSMLAIGFTLSSIGSSHDARTGLSERRLIGRLLRSLDFFDLAISAPAEHQIIEMKSFKAALDFLIGTDTFDDRITTMIWARTMAAEVSADYEACLDSLHRISGAGAAPKHIAHLISLLPTATQVTPRYGVDDLLERCVKELMRKDLYIDHSEIQIEVVKSLKTLLGTLQNSHVTTPGERILSVAINALKTVVHPRISNMNLEPILLECLADMINDDVNAYGSMQTLIALSHVCAHRVRAIIPPRDMAISTFEALRRFVQFHKDKPHSDMIQVNYNIRTHLALRSLMASTEDSLPIDGDELFRITLGEDAIGSLDRSLALQYWVDSADTCAPLAQLLVEKIEANMINMQTITPHGLSYQLTFDFLSDAPSRAQALKNFLTPATHAMLKTNCHHVMNALYKRIDDYLFGSERNQLHVRETEEAQRMVTRACIDVLLDDESTVAVNVLNRFLEHSIKLRTWSDGKQRSLERGQNGDMVLYFGDTAEKDVADVVRLVVIYRSRTGDFRREVWVVNRGTTVAEIEVALKFAVGDDRIRIIRQGRPFDFAELDPESQWFDQPAPEISLLVDTVAEGLAPANKDHGSPRSVIESGILDRYWDIYEQLYHTGTFGHSVASLLLKITYRDDDHPFRHANIDRNFDPSRSHSVWKTTYGIGLVTRHLEHQKKRNFVDETMNVQSIRNLLALLEPYEGNLQLTSDVTEIVKRLLMQPASEQSRSSCFDNPEDTYQLLIKLIADVKDRVVRDASEPYGQVALGHLLECLYESALCNDKIAAKLTEDTDSMALIQMLLTDSGSVVSGVLSFSMSKSIPGMPDPESEAEICGVHASPQANEYVVRGGKIKQWATSFSCDMMVASAMDPSAPPAIYTLAAATFAGFACHTLSGGRHQQAFDQLLEHVSVVGHEDRCDLDVERKVSALCRMLETCAMQAKNDDVRLHIPDETVSILQSFLFDHPSIHESRDHRLVRVRSPECRNPIYQALTRLFEHRHDAVQLLQSMQNLLNDYDCGTTLYVSGVESIRSKGKPVGLENMSMTCYLNSLLQQLFMNYDFRRFILNVAITDVDRQQVLVEIQRTFAFLQDSVRTAYRPEGLTKILDIDVTQQEDAQLFFGMLIGRLEDEMLDEHAKKTFKSFYHGRERSQIKGACGHVSDSTEEFLNLSLTVENMATLSESLDNYVQGEEMNEANKFRCSECETMQRQALVDAHRRTRLDRVPDNLVIGLKRFKYSLTGAEKMNDKLVYPDQIDMARYTVQFGAEAGEQPEPDMFELVGVVIHQGSLNFGHYWSYVKDHTTYGQKDGKWYRIEDSNAAIVTLQDVVKAGVGGRDRSTRSGLWLGEKSDNAYVLFYRRSGSAPDLNGFADAVEGASSVIADAVKCDNEQALHTETLFEPGCEKYVSDLINKECSDCLCERCWFGYDSEGLQLGLSYLLRVSLSGKETMRIEQMGNVILQAIKRNKGLAIDAAETLLDDANTDRWLLNESHDHRKAFNGLFIKVLDLARQADAVKYGTASEYRPQGEDLNKSTLIYKVLERLLGKIDRVVEANFTIGTYFLLLDNFARLGCVEMNLLARSPLLEMAIQLLYVRFVPVGASKFPEIKKQVDARRSFPWGPLILFIAFALTHLTEYRTDRIRGQECDDDDRLLVNGVKRLFPNEEESKLIGTRRTWYGLAYSGLAWAALNALENTNNWHYDQYPPSHLLAAMTYRYSDPWLIDWGTRTLCQALINADNSADFYRYSLPAEYVCLCPEVATSTKSAVLHAVIKEAHTLREIAQRSIALVESVAWAMLGDLKLLKAVTDWMHGLLFNRSPTVRREMSAFIRKVAALDGSRADPASLMSAMLADQTLLQLLTGLTPTIQENIRSRDRGRNEYVKYATATYFGVAESLVQRYKAIMEIDVKEDPIGLYDRLVELDVDEVQRQARGRVVMEIADKWDAAQKLHAFAQRYGWALGERRGRKRDSEELEESSDESSDMETVKSSDKEETEQEEVEGDGVWEVEEEAGEGEED
ncbi:hypothetical protein CAC42_7306 [Sphaceloma murrayae]|uniref:USP domain-containing protein n=1 Tax=Sphaceloma murrayae TaxID=2082308 RepID=A0A2K1QWN4_9PEZI|nr:hypothetical protein CAC42_7306 [Sphaceloma murrayae]